MLKQGDIIKLDFNPLAQNGSVAQDGLEVGHEQAGYRPALVVSNNHFNQKCNVTIVCPITNTNSKFPLLVALDDRTITTRTGRSWGFVLCEHVKSLDLNNRDYKFVEELPTDILNDVIDIIHSQM